MAELIERYRAAFALLLLALTIGGVAAFLARRPASLPIEIATPTRVAKAASAAKTTYASRPSQDTSQSLKVYVTGEVARPGVYALANGDRVEDALRAAGGATADADLISVNLAARVQDQLQINVPRKSATPSAATGQASSQSPPQSPNTSLPAVHLKIDINTATETELDSLPGVGPATAERIITYRQQHGPFTSIEDLQVAKLVNSGVFAKIKDLITAP